MADRGKLFAEKDEKCGFFSQNLQPLTPMKYDSLVITYPDDLYNPKASAAVVRARINNKWGLINNNGKEIIPFNYDELIWVYADLALVKNNGKYGVANLQGKQTADCVYDDIRYNDRNGGVNYVKSLVTKKDGLYGLINSYGMEVAAPVYDNIIPLFIGFTGKYQVSYHGKVGVLDGAYGQLIIPCVYDDLKFYNNDGAGSYARNWHAHWSPYIIAFKNRYYGLIDSMGKVILPIVYDRIDFGEDRYYVSLDGKHGVIDENLIWITPPR